ncbi:polysaccharide deacetylase family protein [Nocardia sp. NPDC003693]
MLDHRLPRRGFLTAGAVLAAGLVTAGCGVANGNSSDHILESAPNPADPRLVPANLPVTLADGGTAAVVAKYAGHKPSRWGPDLSGIRTSFAAQGKQFALTLDACGGPGNNDIDENLLSLLIAQRIPATLFLNKRWIDANPARAEQLAGNPLFELANHGVAHKPLSVNGRAAYEIRGTASVQEAVDEVWLNHERLTAVAGRAPRFFRPGTAHYDDLGVSIVQDLGETPIGYTINADYGATATAAQVQAGLLAAKPGGIALAHMHRPRSGTAAGLFGALPALRDKGFEFVHLP